MIRTKTCVFCGASPTTIEDLWPLWIGKYLGRQEVWNRLISRDRGHYYSAKGMSYAAKAKVVCENCNGGWMKGLEDAASPLLKKMFDERVAFVVPPGRDGNCLILTKWIFKTALMLQYQQPVSVVPPEVYANFYREQMPPRAPNMCSIYLAHHSPVKLPNGTISLTNGHQSIGVSLVPNALEGTYPPYFYAITFFVKNVVMQVVSIYAPQGITTVINLKIPRGFRPYVQWLWPPRKNIEWPPKVSLDDAGVYRFGENLTKIL